MRHVWSTRRFAERLRRINPTRENEGSMTGSLTALLLAMLAFVGGHFVLSAPPVRGRLTGQLGERIFAGVYSLLMILALIWVVAAYRVAPPRVIWDLGPL